MFKRWLWAVTVLAFVTAGTWADDKKPADDDLDAANGALKGGDKAKKPDASSDMDAASKAARGGQDEEPELDPIKALNDISNKMHDAQDALSKAGSWKQVGKLEKEAADKIEKTIKEAKENQQKNAAELQKLIDEAIKKQAESVKDATRMMGGAGKDQGEALKTIEQLIKQAKETG